MVYHGKPQGLGSKSLLVNADNPPQGISSDDPSIPTPPSAPLNLTALAISSTEIDLDWALPAFAGSTPITGYQIERQKEAEGFVIIVANTGNTNVFFNDTALDSDTLYSYRVAAINSVGVGAVSNIASDTTLDPIQPLLAIYPSIADNTYQFYKFYQIKKDQVPSLQTNMSVLIIDSLPIGTFVGTSGNDIRVFDSNGTPLNYELQTANINVDGSGDIILWIDMLVVQDLEFIQVNYGKAGATDGSNAADVYDSNYKMVLHLDGDLLDSTSNDNDATNNGTTSIAGKIGLARDFNGTSDFLNVPNDSSLTIQGSITLSAWSKSPDVAGMIISKYAPTANKPWTLLRAMGPGGMERTQIDLNPVITLDGNIVLSTTEFEYLVATYDGSEIKIFVNGEFDTSVAATGAIQTQLQDITIGKRNPLSVFYEGVIDEPRISDIARSADWIKTEYNNQNDNDAFFFKTPLLENGEDNFLVDDMGRNIVAVIP